MWVDLFVGLPLLPSSVFSWLRRGEERRVGYVSVLPCLLSLSDKHVSLFFRMEEREKGYKGMVHILARRCRKIVFLPMVRERFATAIRCFHFYISGYCKACFFHVFGRKKKREWDYQLIKAMLPFFLLLKQLFNGWPLSNLPNLPFGASRPLVPISRRARQLPWS